jgi:hypothetical protein
MIYGRSVDAKQLWLRILVSCCCSGTFACKQSHPKGMMASSSVVSLSGSEKAAAVFQHHHGRSIATSESEPRLAQH